MANLGALYKSSSDFKNKSCAKALLIACSDFRFRKSFGEFQNEFLKAGDIDRIIVPGGVLSFFAGRYGYPETSQAAEFWTKFLGQHHTCEEVVLIGHEDCAAYARAPKLKGQNEEQLNQEQKEDLIAAGQLIANLLPQAKIRAFFASVDPLENKVEFSEVA